MKRKAKSAPRSESGPKSSSPKTLRPKVTLKVIAPNGPSVFPSVLARLIVEDILAKEKEQQSASRGSLKPKPPRPRSNNG